MQRTNATTRQAALDALYEQYVAHFGYEYCTSSRASFVRRSQAARASRIGTRVKVSMPTKAARSNAAKVYVTGTVVDAAPVRLRYTRRSAQVVWQVLLDTGRTVHLAW